MLTLFVSPLPAICIALCGIYLVFILLEAQALCSQLIIVHFFPINHKRFLFCLQHIQGDSQ